MTTKTYLSDEAKDVLRRIRDGEELRVVAGPAWARVYLGGQQASGEVKGIYYGQLHRAFSSALVGVAKYVYPDGQFTKAEREVETVYRVAEDVLAEL